MRRLRKKAALNLYRNWNFFSKTIVCIFHLIFLGYFLLFWGSFLVFSLSLWIDSHELRLFHNITMRTFSTLIEHISVQLRIAFSVAVDIFV